MPRRATSLLFMCEAAAAVPVRGRKATAASTRGAFEIQRVCSAWVSASGKFACLRNRSSILTVPPQEDRLRSLEGKLGAVLDHLGYEFLPRIEAVTY